MLYGCVGHQVLSMLSCTAIAFKLVDAWDQLLVLAATSLSSDVARHGTSSVTMLESSEGLYSSQSA